MDTQETTSERLEYLRGEIRAERISQGEIAELQSLAEHIDPSDTELLEWAGVEEHAQTLVDRICEALTDDGDEYALDDARTLRLKIEPDDISPLDIWSDDCYGKIESIDTYRSMRFGERVQRPSGFNGRARKLVGSVQGEYYWWQPPADVTDEHLPALQRLVESIVQEGFYSIGIELVDGHDAYRRDIVREAVWLGGIEPRQGNMFNGEPRDYYADIIREQVEEMLHQIGVVAS